MLKPVSNSHSHAEFHEFKEPWIHISSYPERSTESHDVEWNVFLGFYTELVGLGICHVWCKCCRIAPASSDDCGEVLYNWFFAKLANFAVLSEVTTQQVSTKQNYPRLSTGSSICCLGHRPYRQGLTEELLQYCTSTVLYPKLLVSLCSATLFASFYLQMLIMCRSGSCPEMLQWPRKMPGRSWLGLKLRCVVNGQHVTAHSVLNPFVSLHTTIKSLCEKSWTLSYFWTGVSASSRHGAAIPSLMHQTKIRMFERKHPTPFNLWISRRHPGRGVCDGVWLHHWICNFWTAASFYTQ